MLGADEADGDLILCCGAGSITRLPDQLMASLAMGGGEGSRPGRFGQEGVNVLLQAQLVRGAGGGILSGQLSFAEPLAKHTYYRIGGPARVFAVPKSLRISRRFREGIRRDGRAGFRAGRRV